MIDRSVGRVALVNPPWEFQGSRYWACREPHLPLELLYSEALLRSRGFSTLLVDAHLEAISMPKVAERVVAFSPDMIVLTTAPTYLFWRCPPPELTVPQAASEVLRSIAPIVAVGPHGSATPAYVLNELRCAAVIRGEPELELVRLALGEPSPATVAAGRASTGEIASVDVALLPSLDYAEYPLERRTHRHHVFSGEGRGAEVEWSRGCPYGCSFCARRFFRSSYRERSLAGVFVELRRLAARGIDCVYFIDEVFGLGRSNDLLHALAAERVIHFGCQTRIDLWDEGRLDLLAEAGCVSLELGIESPFPEVQAAINKGYRVDGDRILSLMAHAKRRIPWVQGDLIKLPEMDPGVVQRTRDWRDAAIESGVWMSEPVPLLLYPGCDLHEKVLGPIDDGAWRRAREYGGETDGGCAS